MAAIAEAVSPALCVASPSRIGPIRGRVTPGTRCHTLGIPRGFGIPLGFVVMQAIWKSASPARALLGYF